MRLPEFTEAEVAEATGQLPPPPAPPSSPADAIRERASDAPQASGCGDITAAVASLSELGRFDDTTGPYPAASPEAAAVATPEGDITAGVAHLSELGAFEGTTGQLGAACIASTSAALADIAAKAPAPDHTGKAGAASEPMAPAETDVVDPLGIEAAAESPRQQGGWDLTGNMSLCGDEVTASMACDVTVAADTSGESLDYPHLRISCGHGASLLAEMYLSVYERFLCSF